MECIIKDNTAISTGGGIYGIDSNLALINCIISNNTAKGGGGLSVSGLHAHPSFVNCLITGNKAMKIGGGVHCTTHIELLNCTIIDNFANAEGGGIYFFLAIERQINNSILYGNIASIGSEIAIITPLPGVGGCLGKFHKITNSIIGSDPNAIYFEYCNGYLYGEWLHVDPLFAKLGYWYPNDTPDDPNDDFWVDGDYHLKSQAGRWDPNSQSWVIDEVTSLCIDAGDPNTPINDEPFPNGGIINMGAYGGTAEASKSYFGEPLCETIITGDINGDCKVDLKDFMLLANHWLEDKRN